MKQQKSRLCTSMKWFSSKTTKNFTILIGVDKLFGY